MCKGLKVMNISETPKIVNSLCPNIDICPKDFDVPEPDKNSCPALCKEFDGNENFLTQWMCTCHLRLLLLIN